MLSDFALQWLLHKCRRIFKDHFVWTHKFFACQITHYVYFVSANLLPTLLVSPLLVLLFCDDLFFDSFTVFISMTFLNQSFGLSDYHWFISPYFFIRPHECFLLTSNSVSDTLISNVVTENFKYFLYSFPSTGNYVMSLLQFLL